MKILGLDIGQSLGWAVFEDGALVEHGVLAFKRARLEASVERLGALIDAWGPDAIAVEDVRFVKYPDAHASYWRIRTLAELAAEARGLFPFRGVEPAKLKRWATGNGSASKALMCAAAREKYGVDLYAVKETAPDGRIDAQRKREEDQADAILVAAWATEAA